MIIAQQTIQLQSISIDGTINCMDLKQIQAPVEDLLQKTNKLLKKKFNSNIQLLKKISDLTPITKGKKIRSTLFYLLARMHNVQSTELPLIGASMEMLHYSSLIHDDIIDNSKLRRGEKTLNANLGNNISVLGGDFLFIKSLNIINSIQHKYLLDIILKTSGLMIEGQILEVENNFNYKIKLQTYLTIVQKKTASLFTAIAELVSALKKNSSASDNMLYNFGLNFGIMFQISDDILDIFSTNSGKDRFSDLKEGKITLPYILLLDRVDKDIKNILSGNNHKHLLSMFDQFEIKKLSLQKLNKYYKKCLEYVTEYPDSIYKKSIQDLLDFTKDRNY
jgi:octaprenyl-diphosphate synthase